MEDKNKIQQLRIARLKETLAKAQTKRTTNEDVCDQEADSCKEEELNINVDLSSEFAEVREILALKQVLKNTRLELENGSKALERRLGNVAIEQERDPTRRQVEIAWSIARNVMRGFTLLLKLRSALCIERL